MMFFASMRVPIKIKPQNHTVNWI